jgi:hypothetical protein
LQSDAVSSAAELFSDLALSMLEGSSRPDVIVTALPSNLIEKVVNAKSVTEDDEENDVELNLRDLFKSKALLLSAPTQIVWPTLWDDKAKIPRKLKETLRQVQDPATRAWNLMNAIFYKAGKVPWRLPRAESDFKASYLGIGFYKDLSGQRLLTSTAQMFDERGPGLILRGARARTDKGERHPYLERNDAYDLVLRSIKAYRGHHGHGPEHHGTGTCLNHLALVLKDQGDLAAARALLERALAIREKIDPEDLDTATSLNDLALLLQDPCSCATAPRARARDP